MATTEFHNSSSSSQYFLQSNMHSSDNTSISDQFGTNNINITTPFSKPTSTPTNAIVSNSYTSNSYTSTSPAVENAVSSYASRVLKHLSPPQACIDSSVGPYVTSILRCSQPDSIANTTANANNLDCMISDADLESLEEYDSLIELLEEHCNMNPTVAKRALFIIGKAVWTGVLDSSFQGILRKGSFSSFQSSVVTAGSTTMDRNDFNFLNNNKGVSTTTNAGFIRQGRAAFTGRSLSLGAEFDYSKSDSERFWKDVLSERPASLLDQFRQEQSASGDIGVGVGGGHDVIEEEISFLLEEDEAPTRQTSVGEDIGQQADALKQSYDTFVGVTENPASSYFVSSTPLKPDRLISEDLMGIIDNPSTPSFLRHYENMTISNVSRDDTITNNNMNTRDINDNSQVIDTKSNITNINNNPTVSVSTSNSNTNQPTTKPSTSSGKGKKKLSKSTDLAAALFTTSSRSRSSSFACEKSPKLKPMAPPPPAVLGLSGLSYNATTSISAHFQKQLDSTVQILMAMNFDICEEAANEAALVSNADVNLAQHVIDGAVAAPAVCRHMLNDGCYRSDCQFSHDVDGHTCSFWLRGRCGKGASCRFMHGFSEKLLDGIKEDYLPGNRRHQGAGGSSSTSTTYNQGQHLQSSASQASSKPITIKTGNLLEHNMKTTFSLTSAALREGSHNATSFLSSSPGNNRGLFMSSSFSASTGVNGNHITQNTSPLTTFNSTKKQTSPIQQIEVTPSEMTPPTILPYDQQIKPKAFSFASIASKGYSEKSSFSKDPSDPVQSDDTSNEVKFAKIPQDLWNPHYNRSAAAFHISDPLARYEEVSNSVKRDDVIDLHFQSVKSFPTVLATVLSKKLIENDEVWIVTGSGHHVNRNSHQKGGGVLENAVITWLESNGYEYMKGKDKNGFSGAVLVKKG